MASDLLRAVDVVLSWAFIRGSLKLVRGASLFLLIHRVAIVISTRYMIAMVLSMKGTLYITSDPGSYKISTDSPR